MDAQLGECRDFFRFKVGRFRDSATILSYVLSVAGDNRVVFTLFVFTYI